jgi:DNA-binding HxlR family transcriptional regulator/putative sterol carrier protein
MATKRTYGDACGIARALNLVGERWGLLVVRELLLGPKRFTDLRTGLPHVSPNVLSERLGELERAGVVRRRKLGPPAGSRVYELTDWGRELEPTVLALGRWGARSPFLDPGAGLSVDSLVLELSTLFDPEAGANVNAVYELRIGEERFAVRVTDGEVEAERGEARAPDAVIEADPETLQAVLSKDMTLRQAIRDGRLDLTGDVDAVERLLGGVKLPEPAPAPAVA